MILLRKCNSQLQYNSSKRGKSRHKAQGSYFRWLVSSGRRGTDAQKTPGQITQQTGCLQPKYLNSVAMPRRENNCTSPHTGSLVHTNFSNEPLTTCQPKINSMVTVSLKPVYRFLFPYNFSNQLHSLLMEVSQEYRYSALGKADQFIEVKCEFKVFLLKCVIPRQLKQ